MRKVGRNEAATNSRDHGCGLETLGPDRSLGTGAGAKSYLQVRDRPWIVSPNRTLGPRPALDRISGSYFGSRAGPGPYLRIVLLPGFLL